MLERPERIHERYPLVQDPPFTLKNTRTFLFVLPCDHAHLVAMCDRTFGWAAPTTTVEPLGAHCVLAITDTAEAGTADPQLGTFAYREATFFVPVKGVHDGAPFTAMHVPFIYPDEGLAVAAGREIYGLPKKPATLQVPIDDDFWDGSSPITLRALGAEQFDGSPWQDESVMTIQATAHGPVAALADDVLDAIDTLFGPISWPGHLVGQDLVQLKQVPDATPGGIPPRVLYRGITRVRAPVDNFSNVRLGDPGKVSITLADLASEPIRQVLGLGSDPITPTLAASLEMDFAFEPGEVWRDDPDSGATPATKTQVLILGGGLGALATAEMLSATEERRDRYDVRVLAQGHLLGGKGASWRNAARKDRVEEHGLHVIFGFYHNFIRLFREVYEEAARPTHVDPSTFAEAFVPNDDVVFHDGTDGFEVRFPRTPAGYGAGPTSLRQQLFRAGLFVQSIFGGAFSGFLGGLLPGGNPITREIAAFVITLIKGVATDIVAKGKSWEDLDDQDLRAWMASHNPFPVSLDDTAIMQVPYDGVFAYRGSDTSNPRLSAGVAARGLLKLVTDYQRAVYLEMTVGMGEAVFAPIFEVLRDRGVSIELFSKVKELHVSGGSATKVVFGRQAIVTAGQDQYDPFVNVGSVRCWRQDPDPSQLDAGAPVIGNDPYSDTFTGQVGPDLELHVGSDFDWVVCAMPAPVTAHVLRGVPASSPLARIADIPTVATLHLQTWFDDTRAMLGWTWGPNVLGGFEQPLNSMQENTRLLPLEGWSGPNPPRGLFYASGPFPGGWSTDSEDPAARTAAASTARSTAKTWAEDELVKLLPAAEVAGKLDLSRLHHPWTPADPFEDQYYRGNIERSSRYVLMEPGGLKDRPEPVWLAASNLRFAGDWTKNGIDIPCMEGTVVSARMAAASILGVDPDILW